MIFDNVSQYLFRAENARQVFWIAVAAVSRIRSRSFNNWTKCCLALYPFQFFCSMTAAVVRRSSSISARMDSTRFFAKNLKYFLKLNQALIYINQVLFSSQQ